MLKNAFQVGTLRAYEVLKGLTRGTGSRQDALLALLEPEFAARDGEMLDVSSFVVSANKSMKLSLTSDALLDFLPFAARKGFVENETLDQNDPVYRVTCHKPPMPSLRTSEILQALAQRFEDFLHERDIGSNRFPRNNEYLANCLIEWLISIDTTDEISINESINTFSNESDQVQYLSARFIKTLIDEDSKYIPDLQLISDVGLLSELIGEFKKPLNEVKSTSLVILLDSPLLLELSGVSGRNSEQSTLDMLKLLQKKGVRFFYLAQTLAEMKRSLKAMLDLSASERYGPTHAAIQRGEIDELYVRSVHTNSAQVLSDLKVLQLSDAFARDAASSGMVGHRTTDKLANDLEAVYRGQNHGHARARHDAEAVISVVRLRRGEFATDDIFKAKFVFLTRNHAFKSTARAFCLRTQEPAFDGNILTSEEVGPVVDIRELASAVWARMPAEDHANMSKLSIMAGCERVLKLNRRVVTKVSGLVNKMGLAGADAGNEDRIRKVRIAMMVPTSSLYLQDRIRGESRDVDYEDVLREYAQAEKDNIAKGVSKTKTNYDMEIRTLQDELELSVAAVVAAQSSRKDVEAEATLLRDFLAQAQVDREEKEKTALAKAIEDQEKSVNQANRIINRCENHLDSLRKKLRVIAVIVLVIFIASKGIVEKKIMPLLSFEIWGWEVPLWILPYVGFTLLVVAIEATGGIFGDMKIPVVRRWMERKLEFYLASDLELQRLEEDANGVTIVQDGLRVRADVKHLSSLSPSQ